MKRVIAIFVISLSFLIQGCSTGTYVKLPEGSVLKIVRGDELPYEEGLVARTPLSWSSAGGVPYKIEKDGEVIKEGKMRSKFRVASIFWPPAAIIYWPIGFRMNCNDLTVEYPHTCTDEVRQDLKSENEKK